MKKVSIGILLLIAYSFFPYHVYGSEETQKMNTTAVVEVKAGNSTEIVDPENPDKPIDPGDGPSTKGQLRIDYVAPLNFGSVKIKDKDKVYNALAYLADDETLQRGNFIQISDFRPKSTGWTLQIKQVEQFKTDHHDELLGAVLSIDKGWVNSTSPSGAPIVTRDTIAINNIGEVYDVAKAFNNSGSGVWSLVFGASEDNEDNQDITLVTDDKVSIKDNNSANDTEKNKKITSNQVNSLLRNKAIQLTVPENTKIVPGEYKTKFTWILGELP